MHKLSSKKTVRESNLVCHFPMTNSQSALKSQPSPTGSKLTVTSPNPIPSHVPLPEIVPHGRMSSPRRLGSSHLTDFPKAVKHAVCHSTLRLYLASTMQIINNEVSKPSGSAVVILRAETISLADRLKDAGFEGKAWPTRMAFGDFLAVWGITKGVTGCFLDIATASNLCPMRMFMREIFLCVGDFVCLAIIIT
jgi:hypothetical protein